MAQFARDEDAWMQSPRLQASANFASPALGVDSGA